MKYLARLCLFCPWLQAQTPAITTKRKDAMCQQGEVVTYTFKLSPPSGDIMPCAVSKDGVAPVTTGKAQLVNGTASATGRLEEPGFLLCRASFPTADWKSLKASAGAAISPLQIKPGTSAPNDFDAYWSAQKEKLSQTPLSPRLTPQTSPSKNLVVFDLQADCFALLDHALERGITRFDTVAACGGGASEHILGQWPALRKAAHARYTHYNLAELLLAHPPRP